MNIRKFCVLLTSLVFACCLYLRAEDAPAIFRVGAGKRDVTPREPVPMWGYGARHAALSTGALDPLYASAVVIQAGEKKLAIVGLDLGRSPAEKTIQNIRARIKEKAGIEYSFIAGSHTHHGPVLELSLSHPTFNKAMALASRRMNGHAQAVKQRDGDTIDLHVQRTRSAHNNDFMVDREPIKKHQFEMRPEIL